MEPNRPGMAMGAEIRDTFFLLCSIGEIPTNQSPGRSWYILPGREGDTGVSCFFLLAGCTNPFSVRGEPPSQSSGRWAAL